ncbi:MAG: hypothetical protein CMC55_01405, partial [Flavobacteriaceae bacterium]|nr:hypothetical protein [Flavobacteriaceae bacterium]
LVLASNSELVKVEILAPARNPIPFSDCENDRFTTQTNAKNRIRFFMGSSKIQIYNKRLIE